MQLHEMPIQDRIRRPAQTGSITPEPKLQPRVQVARRKLAVAIAFFMTFSSLASFFTKCKAMYAHSLAHTTICVS